MTKATTIKVSTETARLLEEIRRKTRSSSLEEAILKLAAFQKERLVDEAFGADRDRVKPFAEEDRGEDRS